MRRKKAKSGILASVRKTVVGLHKAGLIDEAKMREFGIPRRRVIRTVELTEEEIEQITSGRMDTKHDHMKSLLEN